MASDFVTCTSCNVLVRAQDESCPHCGARRRIVSAPLASGTVLLGLMLAGCPADDSTESMGGSATTSPTSTTDTGGMTTSGSVSQTSTSATTDMSSTTEDDPGTSVQPPYGVPDTTGDTTETDTDGSSDDSTTGEMKLDLPNDGG